VLVKICGITNRADAEAIVAAGADALGFNFWPESERYVDPANATEWITDLPDSVIRVAVLVNPSLAYAKEIAAIDGINCLQLHGAESPEFCLSLVEAQVPLWKAVPMIGQDMQLPDFYTNRLLLDTAAGTKFGGTGTPFPWNWARDIIVANTTREFILAGGLNSENVAEAVHQARPFGVDVASGVETVPGIKDIYQVRDFIAAARSA
jgi:phosphoribosylanthranilate isomerase